MADEKPQIDPDGFVDGVRRIKYSDGFSDFDFAIERTGSGERVIHKGHAGPEYPRILTGWANNIMVDGKLGYAAAKGSRTGVMNFDGVEGPEYAYIDCPLVGIEGKLLYIARKENGSMVANFDNVEGKEYQRVMCPSNIAGKPAYKAELVEKGADGRFTYKWLVVFDGVEGPKYINILGAPREVNGRLAYLAQPELGVREWVLNYDRFEFENRYEERNTETFKRWPGFTTCFIVDGKELVEAHAHPYDKLFFDGREVHAKSFVHFLVEYELAKQRGADGK